jgi:SAM-dependent methyltransferase
MPKDWSSYNELKYLSKELLNKRITLYTILFEKFNIDTHNQTVIEVGAGYGRMTEVFINLFKNYTAIEPDKTLFNELKNLQKKYTELKILNYSCETIPLEGQLSFIIFTYSFQYTDFEKCKKIIDNLLKKNGHLLILLPKTPFIFSDNFNNKKHTRWRKTIINTIHFLLNMENYETVYINGIYDILIKKLF